VCLGLEWPVVRAVFFDIFKLPLLNTILLVISSVFLTIFHENLFVFNLKKEYLAGSVVLGLYFFIIQIWEYMSSFFSFRERVIGSSFFIFTGFHGGHVFLGGVYLLIMLLILKSLSFFITSIELGIWYWHFVDVVWLFLFSILYWWGR